MPVSYTHLDVYKRQVRKYEEGGTVSCFAVLGKHLIEIGRASCRERV